MSSAESFELLCDNIFALSPNIRFVGVINGMGDLVAGGMREGVQSMEDKDSSPKCVKIKMQSLEKQYIVFLKGRK